LNRTEKQNTGEDIVSTLGLDSSPGKKAFWKRWYVWVGLAVLVTIILLFWLRGQNGNGLNYKTENPTRGSLVVTVTATGNLEPTNQVEVGSELSGIVESVAVDYNDVVKVGQVLARLDTSKLKAQVLQSRAAVESARANVLQAQATLKVSESDLQRLLKVRELSGGKVPSQQDVDTAEATLERAKADVSSAKAAVSQAQATLDENETDLGKAAILSPINGVVLERSVEPGQTVAASLQAPVLFTLAEDLTQMELQVDVDEADVGQVKEGQEANFTVDAYPDNSFPARITQVRYGSEEVDGVVTYKAVLGVNNADLLLRPGMTATADIVVEKVDNALLIPNAALRYSPPVTEKKSTRQSGSLISSLFPRPPHSETTKREESSAEKKTQTVWVLKGGQPVSVAIATGLTEGIHTEVLQGDIDTQTPLIVDTVSAK